MSGAPAALEQVVLHSETLDVTVLPGVGARLHRLTVDGHDLLRTPADPRAHLTDPFFWGGYHMAPWCNRLPAAPVQYGERVINLPINFPDGTAIHGQVYAAPWRQVGDSEFGVEAGGNGWPWPYGVEASFGVDRRTLRIEQRLTNLADEPMPAGIGLHPWFRRPVELLIRAQRFYSSNLDSEPEPRPVEGAWDMLTRTQPAAGLDATWTAIAHPPVELAWPGLGIRAEMHVGPTVDHIVAATPAHIDAIAVEPETHAPQALRRVLNGEPGGLRILQPGEQLALTAQFAFI